MMDTAVRAAGMDRPGVLSLPALLITLDFSVLNLAVAALSADLRPGGTQLLWIADIAGFLATMSMLGDRIGRRRVARPRSWPRTGPVR